MKCYAAAINDEIMQFTVNWLELEHTVLSEVNLKKCKYKMISLTCGILNNWMKKRNIVNGVCLVMVWNLKSPYN